MINILLRLIILIAGIFLTAYIIPGITVEGTMPAIKDALLLGFLNVFVRPVLVLLTLPITRITLGVFTFIINGFLFWVAGQFISGFGVSGFLAALGGAAVVGVLNMILGKFLK